jgi:hypothetical protein
MFILHNALVMICLIKKSVMVNYIVHNRYAITNMNNLENTKQSINNKSKEE